MVRVLVVGGGLAGSLLAWRLAGRAGARVDLRTGGGHGGDATAASGGAVRGYEPAPAQRELALASLAELLASAVLRDWAGYRETGFAFLHERGAAAGDELATACAEINRAFPGSAELTSPAEAVGGDGGPGWDGGDRVAVRERRAGATSPGRLRDAVLTDLASRPGVAIRDDAPPTVATALAARPARPGEAGPAGGYDAVVLAAGAWTPALLQASGLPDGGYRTRSIQYTVYDTGPVQPAAFADEPTGLYGLPAADGGLLLGLPTTEWDVPGGPGPVAESRQGEAARLAAACFPGLKLGRPRQRVAMADCYCAPPVLLLREITPDGPAGSGGPRVFTFTGGSGGAAKTALAASLRAAGRLTEELT